ncbi:hypothetical protein BCR35DRAFT_305948 [Leucosporidium creatinivorum]|uniref:Bet v1-like protein n=1 Tax=Leucosporidium creatinivorum TaxID=106004 RepID=A0A1Y2EXG0_9BASI|nr:hypothetical protein BCR35DRAFT_305948 [Leucosporidium creatinivorum]
MSIPTSTYVLESSIVNAPLSATWHKIKLGDFASWWSALKSSSAVKGADAEADLYSWEFNDGTKLQVKQEEHSSINHSITYSVVSAEPALTYSSVVSKIELSPITSGPLEGSTYVSWSGNFSSDADAGVIEDARFKRKEALADLAKAASV